MALDAAAHHVLPRSDGGTCSLAGVARGGVASVVRRVAIMGSAWKTTF